MIHDSDTYRSTCKDNAAPCRPSGRGRAAHFGQAVGAAAGVVEGHSGILGFAQCHIGTKRPPDGSLKRLSEGIRVLFKGFEVPVGLI